MYLPFRIPSTFSNTVYLRTPLLRLEGKIVDVVLPTEVLIDRRKKCP